MVQHGSGVLFRLKQLAHTMSPTLTQNSRLHCHWIDRLASCDCKQMWISHQACYGISRQLLVHGLNMIQSNNTVTDDSYWLWCHGSSDFNSCMTFLLQCFLQGCSVKLHFVLPAFLHTPLCLFWVPFRNSMSFCFTPAWEVGWASVSIHVGKRCNIWAAGKMFAFRWYALG